MCNGFNLRAIFGEGDLVNGAGAYECEITRNPTPESQEFSRSGTSFCWRRLGAARCWTLPLRFDFDFWRVIAAVVTLGILGFVAIISARNENGARIGDERTELPKSRMWLHRRKIENLSADLRVRARGIRGCLGVDEGTRATGRHAQQTYGGWRVDAEAFTE
jgi:hypothetical protein